MPQNLNEIPRLVQDLYKIVGELERQFPKRKFTPDGHLVGSIGEVLAASIYGLKLLRASTEVHDARAGDGRLVQIKATQGRVVGIRAKPEHLVVLQLYPDGSIAEAYNGPGQWPWDSAGKMQSNGQRMISVRKLRGLMAQVEPTEKLERRKGVNYAIREMRGL